ncbi:hypothetical protein EHS39_33015 [Ensifer sp. MPMI2T]|nr:hypothetical protein EHS39_33015 [Ensifer sp. MPMI2T]
MNDYDAGTKLTRRGYLAMLRTAGDAEMKPILSKGGEAIYYPDELTAHKVATEHLLRYINGHLVRAGEIAGETAAAANAVFKKVVKQRGKSRQITVAYKRGLAK